MGRDDGFQMYASSTSATESFPSYSLSSNPLSLSLILCTLLSIYLLASIPPHPRTPLRFARDNDSGGTPYSREYRGREV